MEAAFFIIFTVMTNFGNSIIDFGNFIWGTPLLILLLGGGFFFSIFSRLKPLRYFRHTVSIISGKYDSKNDEGHINHYQALSTALAATVGMGNISGVAVAITMGGPGTIFWMWISAILGVATKFYTCSLAVMFRGKDDKGRTQGGPMYYILYGLGKKWKPMALFFSFAGMFAVFPMFQSNQLTQVFRDVILVPNGIPGNFLTNLIIGSVIALLMALVIFGGIKRIGNVTGRLVPLMVVIYILAVLYIIFSHPDNIAPAFKLIFHDAFHADSVLGGALGSIMIMGVRRAAFSNEAGIGTAPMAHGAAKTSEPIREGLVAMMGPIIDTVVVCTMTALAVICTGVWNEPGIDGITLTAKAFNIAMPGYGAYLLIICVTFFALSTIFAYPFYGTQCSSFIFGTRSEKIYRIFSVSSVILAAVVSLDVVIGFIDSIFALMAFPNMLAAILLAPKVNMAAKKYFVNLKNINKTK